MKVLVRESWPRTRSVFCVLLVFVATVLVQVASLSGTNVCMVQQKYNITKRVKYRAPMSVRTYEWCFSIPPRCSRWKTEMRDLTRLETEERMAEVAVCCPGYKMKDVACIPICPNGKTGSRCTEECPPNKWGPNCVHECGKCLKGFCSPISGLCECLDGWQGESCNIRMTTMSPPALMEELLTTTKSTIQTSPSPSTKLAFIRTTAYDVTTTVSSRTWMPVNKPISLSSTTKMYPNSGHTTTISAIKTIIYEKENITSHKVDKAQEGRTTSPTINTHLYNRTESSAEGTSISLSTEHVSATTLKIPLITKPILTQRLSTTTPVSPSTSTISTTRQSLPNITEQITTTENVRKVEPASNSNLTAIKIKPKEIWIKPTQKGISTEFKIKINHDSSLPSMNGSKSEFIPEITTPRTIIVSIIPTSVSHISFKKIAFTTASYLPTKTNVTIKKLIAGDTDKIVPGFTKSMSIETSTQAPFTIKILSTLPRNISTIFQSKNLTKPTLKHTSRKNIINASHNISTSSTKVEPTEPTSTVKSTNSMLTTPSTSTVKKIFKASNAITLRPPTNTTSKITTKRTINFKDETKYLKDDIFKTQGSSLKTTTVASIPSKVTTQSKPKSFANLGSKISSKNITKTLSKPLSTEAPTLDETFHILTEPEHITAVMSEKERERSSLDLISVVSVAGGIMMAVITVAVIIVMFERCRRPRYEDVRKINDIRMQVMIDNDVPPPYVRSIFHTPLPEPPKSEKCHYQPISTLDRNLKQFMRPVVVQNISPIMMENFRGILECHYDHLPRRSHDVEIEHLSLAPSMIYDEKLQSQCTLSMAESTIDALKCEAKLNSIETENSEPLYAEIPCWRPPSEHAIEVINLNGEAVTEL